MSTNPKHTAPIIMNAKITTTALESDSVSSTITLRCTCHSTFPGGNDSRHKEFGHKRESQTRVDQELVTARISAQYATLPNR